MLIFEVIKDAIVLAKEAGRQDLVDGLLEAEKELKDELSKLQEEQADGDVDKTGAYNYEH